MNIHTNLLTHIDVNISSLTLDEYVKFSFNSFRIKILAFIFILFLQLPFKIIKKLAHLILSALLILAINGCSTITEYSDAVVSNIPVVNYFSGSNFCNIKVKSSKTTNNGSPFYALVKATDYPTFLSDNYTKIANAIIFPPEDQACFEIFCVVPGRDQMITIETPEIKSIGIYFLFTNPGITWNQFIDLKDGCPVIKFVLEENQIASVEL